MPKQIDFYQISLKLILLNDKGEILALKAVEGGTFAGFYDLPGGRINTDEFTTPFLEILKREINEEIGNVQITVGPDILTSGKNIISTERTKSKEKDIHILCLFFKGHYLNGDIKISSEHADYKWLNLNEIVLEKYFTQGLLEGLKTYLSKYA